ncbi:MAG: MarR family transcriptional regulator [Salinibacterium sp.]|nr:MarR family transcriptional regulator [Salinibacterium sp.]
MATRRTRKALFDAPVPADDVVVRCTRLADAIALRIAPFFKEHGLTALQYNVLRILYVRDESGEGLPSGTIGAGLMVRVPDVTRLVDRLEAAGWVERFRLPEDRRVVRVKLTREGTALVERVHAPLVAHNREMFSRMAFRDLERLSQLLADAQAAID